MKKSFMNIKNFVDSNVRQRIDRVSNNNNDFFGDELLIIEKQFDDLRQVCVEAEKRIAILLQSIQSSSSSTLVGTYTQNVQASLSNLTTTASSTTTTTSPIPPNTSSPTLLYNEAKSLQYKSSSASINCNEISDNNHAESSSPTFNQLANDTSETLRDDIRRHKKLPIVGFLKFLNKTGNRLKSDSLLTTTFNHCSKLQTQLTELYLNYEQTIESQCLKPIQQVLENDIPNIIKLRKVFIRSHNDLETIKAKFNGLNQKQQHSQLASQLTGSSYTVGQTSAQQATAIKLDQLKKETDDALNKFEQARDTYATELYAFVCREAEIVSVFLKLYAHQADYHQQVTTAIQSSLPSLNNLLAITPRKPIFGMHLDEHLKLSGRPISLVIDLSIHLLYLNALDEEGLFRIPGSSVKVKKLKNAINAWFVTLASQKELETTNLPTHSGNLTGNSAAVYAIYNLFKDIIAQRPQQTIQTSGSSSSGGESPTDIGVHPSQNKSQHQQQLVFDVHTIAGLLKLYLRELPEPLLTFDLYDQWISVALRSLKKEDYEISLKYVISKLPQANYNNLRHLIRFLHILTCFREQNKMTATNLAITLAPSLIWSKPIEIAKITRQGDDHDDNDEQQSNMEAFNMQMSSVGMSASLHAVVIEKLISQAEELFPGAIQFTLPGFTRTYKLNNKTNRNASDYPS